MAAACCCPGAALLRRPRPAPLRQARASHVRPAALLGLPPLRDWPPAAAAVAVSIKRLSKTHGFQLRRACAVLPCAAHQACCLSPAELSPPCIPLLAACWAALLLLHPSSFPAGVQHSRTLLRQALVWCRRQSRQLACRYCRPALYWLTPPAAPMSAALPQQLASHLDSLPLEAWVLLLVVSKFTGVAVCGALCLFTARWGMPRGCCQRLPPWLCAFPARPASPSQHTQVHGLADGAPVGENGLPAGPGARH